MFPPYVWHFTARAIEPAKAIFFYGTILREYCERDHSLGYELFKRMSGVMIKRLQAAREKMAGMQCEPDLFDPAADRIAFCGPGAVDSRLAVRGNPTPNTRSG